MIEWPKWLIPQVARRRCIFFLGAGASAGAVSTVDGGRHPPTWDPLLRSAASLIPAHDRTEAEEFIAQKRYLDAARIIVGRIRVPDFGHFLHTQYKQPAFKPSEIHQIVYEIRPRIVMTTNIDDLFETHVPAGGGFRYNVCRYYDRDVLDLVRCEDQLLLKTHGCITNPSNAVFTKKQYAEARKEYRSFFDVLDALFLTHTVLFIGYGIDDPDIQLLLEHANIVAQCKHPHYAIMEAGRHPEAAKEFQSALNVEFLEYPQGKHDEVVVALKDLEEQARAQLVFR